MAFRTNMTPCLQGIKIIISLYSQCFRAAQPFLMKRCTDPLTNAHRQEKSFPLLFKNVLI